MCRRDDYPPWEYEPGSIKEKLDSLERAIRYRDDDETYDYILSLIHEILTAIVADSSDEIEEPEVPSGGPD